MFTYNFLLAVFLQILGAQSLIVPDEIPSLLSIVYSNIPTVKKGTDSRLGYGFRLGDRADVQFLIELGPQTNTQALANEPEKEEQQGAESQIQTDTISKNTNKRSTAENFMNIADRVKSSQNVKQVSNEDGAKWLEKWRQSFKSVGGIGMLPVQVIQAKPGLGVGEIDAKSVIPPDEVQTPAESEGVQAVVLGELQNGKILQTLEDEASLLRLQKLLEKLQIQPILDKQYEPPTEVRKQNPKPSEVEVQEESNVNVEQMPVATISNNQPSLSFKINGNSQQLSTASEKQKQNPIENEVATKDTRAVASNIKNFKDDPSKTSTKIGKTNVVTSTSSKVAKVSPSSGLKDNIIILTARKIIAALQNASSVASVVKEITNKNISEPVAIRKQDDDVKLIGKLQEQVSTTSSPVEDDEQENIYSKRSISSFSTETPDGRLITISVAGPSFPVISINQGEDQRLSSMLQLNLDSRDDNDNEYMENDDYQEQSTEPMKVEKDENIKNSTLTIQGARKSKKLEKNKSAKISSRSIAPLPNETLLEYILRRLGYNEYFVHFIRSELPLIPEAKRGTNPDFSDNKYNEKKSR